MAKSFLKKRKFCYILNIFINNKNMKVIYKTYKFRLEPNRDINAAKNILDEGLRNISAGTVDYTDGDDV